MNKYKFYIGILIMFVFMVLSLLLLLYPNYVINSMYYGIGIALFIVSLVCIIYFIIGLKKKEKFKYYILTYGFIGLLVAGFIILKKDSLTNILNIVVGILINVVSALLLQFTFNLKKKNGNYIITLFITIVNMLLGIILIFNPFSGAFTLTTFISIIVFIVSLLNIIMLITYKINYQE